MRTGSTVRRSVEQVALSGGAARRRTRRDALAAEEPLEIRVLPGSAASASPATPISVTMRTPGADFELAAGFLFGEALIEHAGEIDGIRYCVDANTDGSQQYNIVNVALAPGVAFDAGALRRHFYTTSSCGVCGKASIEAVRALTGGRVERGGLRVRAETLLALPAALRSAQSVFERTGGLHAAAAFTSEGAMIRVREDIGRHNALDKLIGAALLAGELPLANRLLLVSGRLSFELVQKAVRAGAPLLAGVSAPSSLAVELAQEAGLTLIGFLRDGRFNVYAGLERLEL